VGGVADAKQVTNCSSSSSSSGHSRISCWRGNKTGSIDELRHCSKSSGAAKAQPKVPDHSAAQQSIQKAGWAAMDSLLRPNPPSRSPAQLTQSLLLWVPMCLQAAAAPVPTAWPMVMLPPSPVPPVTT
jgi:hypothetical protein